MRIARAYTLSLRLEDVGTRRRRTAGRTVPDSPRVGTGCTGEWQGIPLEAVTRIELLRSALATLLKL